MAEREDPNHRRAERERINSRSDRQRESRDAQRVDRPGGRPVLKRKVHCIYVV